MGKLSRYKTNVDVH